MTLILAATGLGPVTSAGSEEASTAEPGGSLSDRVSRLESGLAGGSRDEALQRGKVTYARFCAACHGRTGAGDGPAARGFYFAPRDLTVNHYRFRSTPTGAPPRPEDLERIISKGMPGTSMSGFEDLFSAGEISDLVAFVYSLQPATAAMEQPPEAVPIPGLLPEDPSRYPEGRAMYLLMGCWKCHGMNGSGRGPSARDLKDDADRPIRSTDFRYDPLKGGRDAEAIVRSLLTGLNGAPTPAYEDSAILVPGDFVLEDPGLETRLTPLDRDSLEVFRRRAPSSQQLEEMDEEARKKLRDRRLYDLAYYVLSMDRRKAFGYRAFRQRPELEPRRP
jgi:mono/diheme cytochrome c family protein